LTLDPNIQSGSHSTFNKWFIKFNGDKSKNRVLDDTLCTTISKTQNVEWNKTESEKRLLGFMDKNKLYINSLREHIRTNSPKKVRIICKSYYRHFIIFPFLG
jgi:hypothetical protein